jgi:carbohydrate-selective porin OprB
MGAIPSYQKNHGFNFQGSPSFHPKGSSMGSSASNNSGGSYSANGLYQVSEIGWTPKFGKEQLEGHYALGGYLWGQKNTDYNAPPLTSPIPSHAEVSSDAAAKQQSYQEHQMVWGLYVQADQQLTRAKESQKTPPEEEGNPSHISHQKLSNKGLFLFNEAALTRPQNNAMPFYCQTGVVYRGLFQHRDEDALGISVGAGFYSTYYNQYIHHQNQSLLSALGNADSSSASDSTESGKAMAQEGSGAIFTGASMPAFTSTEVIEVFYNIQINAWISVKPYAQLIVNPAGNGTLANDWILGASVKAIF